MTTVMPGTAAIAPLAPVTMALRQLFGTDDVPGLAHGLLVADEVGWSPATSLVDGTRLPELLAAATDQWGGTRHASAALAWKAYCYWAALPAVLGWASARRVPLLVPADVLIHLADHRSLLTLGLRRSTAVAVLPGDPLALAGRPEVQVVAGEAELLAALRATLLDAHLAPMIAAIQAEVRIGARTLLGSVAAGIANAILRAADGLPGSSVAAIDTLLSALDLRDLVELVPDPAGELMVQRCTCCLAFTLPRPTTCAGCCLRRS